MQNLSQDLAEIQTWDLLGTRQEYYLIDVNVQYPLLVKTNAHHCHHKSSHLNSVQSQFNSCHICKSSFLR